MKKQFAIALLSCTAMSWANPALAHGRDQKPASQTKAGPPAVAQATQPVQVAQAGPEAGQIVVTGSRIVRTGYTAPTPVTVASTEDLLKTTPSSVPDALNKLPQFENSLSSSRSALNFSNVPIHGNVLNLRGLGTTSGSPKGPLRTLILFDGIRVPPTEYTGIIDTNVLPQLLMQRVDVVTGGASAQWGSDAVAGVVNFVLDKKFTGIKGVVQAGMSERGDNHNQRIGAAAGFNFAGDRGHILLSGEYNHNDGMLRADRDISLHGYNFVGANAASCSLAANRMSRICTVPPGTAANPFVIAPDIRISALAPNGRITGSSVVGNPFVGQVINNDGTTRPFNLGTAVGTTGFQQGGDGYKISPFINAVAPVKTYQTFGRIAYDVVPDVTAYVEGLWSRSDLTFLTQTNSLIPPTEQVRIYKGNPFLPAAIDATLPTANDFITVGQQDAGQPAPVDKERTDFWMATAGLEGKFSNLNWNVNYTHGQSTHTMNDQGLYFNRHLFAAVDAVLVNGVPTCRVLTNPATAAAFAGCQPLDVMHGNPDARTPAGYAYATGTSSYHALVKQDSATANLSGSLFNLPAGPVDFAVGAEWRKQSLDLTTNADPALLDNAAKRAAYFAGLRGVPGVDAPGSTLFYWLTNVGSARGRENVKEAYAELAVPVLKDVPAFHELSLNGAARITDYSTSGTVKTWKAGAIWSPVPDIRFRGTISRDIRAPNLFELFAGAQSGIGIVNDKQIKNAAGTPVYGSGLNVNANTVTSGNPNLKPEIGKTWTVGAVLTPSFLHGFSAAIDWYHIKVTKLIDQLSSQQILDNCFNAGGSGVPECALIDRASPTTFPSLIHIVPANIAFLDTKGIDFDASYRSRVGPGTLNVRLYANYLDKFDTQQYKGAPIAHFAGVNVVGSNPAGYPRWRGNLTADYAIGPLGVTVSEQYINHMRLDQPGSAARIVFVNNHVPAVWYTDLAVRYTPPGLGGHVEVFGTVNNLFDKAPPLIPGTVPGVNLPTNIAVYDFIGRSYTAGVRFKFGAAAPVRAAPPPLLPPPPAEATQTCPNGSVMAATATCPAPPAPPPPPPPPAPAPERG